MMKKYLHIIIILLCIIQSVHTQNIDKEELILDAAFRYTPHDDSFYSILDALTSDLQNCIFNALGRDYFFDIDIYNNNTFRAQIYAHLSYPRGIHPVAFESFRDVLKAKKGFLYYNEKLVLVSFTGERWSQYDVRKIFSLHPRLECIMYSIPAETFPEVGMGLEVSTLYGIYNPDTESFTVTKSHECTGDKYYGYTVQETDTWAKIAAKFGTTEENIRTINNEYNPDQCLVPGSYISVHYEIVDGVLEVTRYR
jgi:hypothetical protein